MGEGFIVRRGGGGAERTSTPSINFVSSTAFTIVVTFTNTESETVDLYYGLTTPPVTKITLNANATSSNITFSGLTENTAYDIYAYSLVSNPVSKKIKSEIFSTTITTPLRIQYMNATGGNILEYDLDGIRYRSHTFTSSGDFVVTELSEVDANRNRLDYIIQAGGGSGGAFPGFAWASGGGGAGGYRSTVSPSGGNSSPLTRPTAAVQTYPIIVGGGGVERGNPSSAFGVSTTGGGRGAGNQAVGGNFAPSSGGSGGGGGGNNNNAAGGTSGQGFGGGGGASAGGDFNFGGGGGGAGGGGGTGTFVNNQCGARSFGGAGGAGITSNIRTGTNEVRGRGGGGGRVGNAESTDWQGNLQCFTERSGAGGGQGSVVIIRYQIAPSV